MFPNFYLKDLVRFKDFIMYSKKIDQKQFLLSIFFIFDLFSVAIMMQRRKVKVLGKQFKALFYYLSIYTRLLELSYSLFLLTIVALNSESRRLKSFSKFRGFFCFLWCIFKKKLTFISDFPLKSGQKSFLENFEPDRFRRF